MGLRLNKEVFIKWLNRTVLLSVFWLACLSVYIVSISAMKDSKSADVLIVLGAAVYGNKPSPVFQARLDAAVDAYKQGLSKHIILTGGRSQEDTLSESQAGKQYLLQQGVAEALIDTESISKTTLQNLQQAKIIMDSKRFKDAIIITDPLHIARASIMSKNLGIKVYTYPTVYTKYVGFMAKFKFLMRELSFIHVYWIFNQ